MSKCLLFSVAEQKELKTKDEVAPEFVSDLTSCQVTEGQAVVLECAVKGKPPPEVHWYKDGKEVKPDKDHKIEALPDGTLKLSIQKATSKDVGDYTVEAVSPAGKATTEGHLDVKCKYFCKMFCCVCKPMCFQWLK